MSYLTDMGAKIDLLNSNYKSSLIPSLNTKDLKKEQIQFGRPRKRYCQSCVLFLAIWFLTPKILIADDKEKSEYEIWSYEELDYFLNLDIVKESLLFFNSLDGMRRGKKWIAMERLFRMALYSLKEDWIEKAMLPI